MNRDGCVEAFLVGIAIVGSVVGCIVITFALWWYGAFNYSVGAPAPSANVCPASFQAITLIIEQQRQTVVCSYDEDYNFVHEVIHERNR